MSFFIPDTKASSSSASDDQVGSVGRQVTVVLNRQTLDLWLQKFPNEEGPPFLLACMKQIEAKGKL